MTINRLLYCCQITVQQRSVSKNHRIEHQIRVAFFFQKMMEQDTVLQRRQGIDILNIRYPSRHLLNDVLNLRLGQINQRQHRRRQHRSCRGDDVGWHHHSPVPSQRLSQFRQHRRLEQITCRQCQPPVTQTLNHLHAKQ
ncbi:hypothetical protein Ppb6_01719 [Photorhabdus australis subsp. thailandensis]|uniref:Uncharacterized protein n=1 Tax=Photorhabdus australis subsp. thailandensis TaxID=2805096 RepID=A0A1C0U5C0_9GAMM|nr:hypothetical protein Ppb6_01719 [Photorhabdus australis subsp. thailandensis]